MYKTTNHGGGIRGRGITGGTKVRPTRGWATAYRTDVAWRLRPPARWPHTEARLLQCRGHSMMGPDALPWKFQPKVICLFWVVILSTAGTFV